MPGFLDKLKSGAERAAFEADRLRRSTQAQSTLRALQRDLEAQMAVIGEEVVALYDAGSLTQPELLALCPRIDELRAQIQAQEAEVERIRQEEPPADADEEPVPPSEAAAAVQAVPDEAPASAPQGSLCPSCGSPLPADVRFCPECGANVTGA
jgi:hypothetical protein